MQPRPTKISNYLALGYLRELRNGIQPRQIGVGPGVGTGARVDSETPTPESESTPTKTLSTPQPSMHYQVYSNIHILGSVGGRIYLRGATGALSLTVNEVRFHCNFTINVNARSGDE